MDVIPKAVSTLEHALDRFKSVLQITLAFTCFSLEQSALQWMGLSSAYLLSHSEPDASMAFTQGMRAIRTVESRLEQI